MDNFIINALHWVTNNPATYIWIVAGLLVITLAALLLKAYFETQKGIGREASIETKPIIVEQSTNLADTLTAMHRRLVELQNEKLAHTKPSYSQLEEAMPILADKMGAIKIKDWPRYLLDLKSRIRKASPRRPIPRGFIVRRDIWIKWQEWKESVRLIGISIVKEAIAELLKSKEWAWQDGVKISAWMDAHHWGIQDIRDNNQQWKNDFESIGHYLKQDATLRELINEHIETSRFYNDACLIDRYSQRVHKTSLFISLYEAIVESPISPVTAEIHLAKVLGEIEKRLAEIGEGQLQRIASLIIQDKYEDNDGECGLIVHNTSSVNLNTCRARILNSAYETPHSRYSLDRYFKAEDLICTEDIPQFGFGKISIFKWGLNAADKDLKIIYKRGTHKIGYKIVSVPILILLNVWADNVPNTYAICKLEDRVGWGFNLSIMRTGLQQENPQLSIFQQPNSDSGGSQT